MPLLDVRNLSKRFGNVQAVKDFSITIKRGEIVGLVGPNGAGKTTAIECITTIQNADSGQIYIEGYDVYTQPEKAKAHIGFVPEIPALVPTLSVIEYIQVTAELFNAEDWKERAEELLRGFSMQNKKNSYTWALSKGEKQKVAIISALAHSPNVLFLDEPLLGIDPHGAHYFKKLMRERAGAGCGILISSHVLSLIEDIAHRIMIMDSGTIVASGTLEELRRMAHEPGDLENIFLKITGDGRNAHSNANE